MIQRVTDPAVLGHPAIAPWLSGICTHFAVRAEAYIGELCAAAHTQVLIGIEDQALHALLITQLPTPLMLLPVILLGYNDGSRALGHEMMAQAFAFAREAGYTSLFMANRSGRSDAAYARGLSRIGMVIGQHTVFEVTQNEMEPN